MKKSLLSFGACLAVFAASAQTEIEPFAPSVPGTYLGAFEEWTELDNIPDLSSNWTDEGNVSSNDIICDETSVAGWTFSGKYALSGAYPGENVILVSPEIDFGTATTNPTVDFSWRNSNESGLFGTGMLELLYKESSGGAWNVVATYTAIDNVWHNESVDLTGASSYSTYYLGWRFTGISAGGFYDFSLTAIDEITLTGETGCTNTANSITETACFSYTVPSGDETYSTAGTQTVMDTIPNQAGCDSVLTINLTINDVDTSITDNMDGSLTADLSSATYQWLEGCNGTPSAVSGATNQTFSASTFGYYSCEITLNGCTDTSSCYYVMWEGIEEYATPFNIYPNPSKGEVMLDLSAIIGKQLMTITNLNGKIVSNEMIVGGSQVNISLKLESGVYIISLVDQEGFVRRSKLIIE